MNRPARKSRPVIEGLEERKLLNARIIAPNGEPINDKDLARAQVQKVNLRNGSFWHDRRKVFPAPGGGKIVLTLHGRGTLKGTYQDATGALNVVYDDTNASSQLSARVNHGRGHAPLRSLRDADVSPNSISGVGSNQLGGVRFIGMDLIDGGQINLSGGVGLLRLNSVGANTRIDARSLPLQPGEVNPSPTSPQPSLIFVDSGNGPELTGVGGLLVPGAAGTTSTTTTTETIPGMSLVINQVNAAPRSVTLADPQVFGYDPTSQQLVRFDARTGGVLGAIPVSNNGATETGVGLGRVQGHQVVLVGTGNLVQAFDVVTGAPRGSFLTDTIPGFTTVTGIGQTDRGVGLSDSTANLVQAIDLDQSIATGHVVPAGTPTAPVAPFTPTRDFTLSGGATGVAGLSNGFLTGAAFFDSFQPTTTEFGVLTVNTVKDQLVETARTAVTSPSSIVSNVPPTNTPIALGSVDQSLALVTAVNTTPGTNTMTLYDPRSLAAQGSVNLLWANRLTGLSESFHPELQGAAIINVGGIVKRMQVARSTGMVVNTIGFLNEAHLGRATDAVLVADPIGHISIAQRNNVTILSTADRGSPKGGVTLVPGLRPVGPLTSPG